MLASWWLQGVAAVAVVTALVVLVLAGRAVSRANAARDAAERRSRAQAEELAKALNMRAEADAALRASQAQFQSIMRHAPMMVALKDLQGRYTFVNEAFREYTGRDADIVIGKTAADFYPRELADFIAREDRDAVESRRVIQREMTPQLDARRANRPAGEISGLRRARRADRCRPRGDRRHRAEEDRGPARAGTADRIARSAHRRDRA